MVQRTWIPLASKPSALAVKNCKFWISLTIELTYWLEEMTRYTCTNPTNLLDALVLILLHTIHASFFFSYNPYIFNSCRGVHILYEFLTFCTLLSQIPLCGCDKKVEIRGSRGVGTTTKVVNSKVHQ